MRLPLGIYLAMALLANTAALHAADGPASPSITIWRMDRTDEIGGNATTVLGSPQVVSTPEGKIVHFDGIADGVFVLNNPLAGCQAFTIEVLFKPETGGPAEQRFFHVEDKAGNRALLEIRLMDQSWALDTFLYSDQAKSRLPLLDKTKLHPADQWTWVALVYANGHMAHYIDGVKELEGEVSFTPMLAGKVSLGVRQNKVHWFKGSMREVRFHSVALTEENLQRAKAE